MRLLRHQWAKDWNQFSRRDIIEPDDLRDVFVVSHRTLVFHDWNGRGTGVFAGHNPDHLAAPHRGVTLHIENGQEQIIELGL